MSDGLRGHSIRYLIIGTGNTGFTLVLFTILNHYFSATAGVQTVYWSAALLGIIIGFFWQRFFVWRSRGRWRSEIVRFLAINLAVTVANSITLYLAVDVFGLPTLPSQFVITGILVIALFIVNRTWVFRTVPSRDLGDDPGPGPA